MSYIQNNLAGGEQIRHRTTYHWVVYLRSISALLIAGLAAAAAFHTPTEHHVAFFVISGFCVALAAAMAIPPFWRQLTTEIVCTDQRVIVKTGFIARHTQELNLSSIESVFVDQSIWGRLLGFGDLRFKGSGETIEHCHHINQPDKFRRAVEAR